MENENRVDALSIVGLSRLTIRYLKLVGSNMLIAFRRWQRDDGASLAAAVSYYMALSLFPMLLLLTGGLGLAMRYSKLGNDAHQQILSIAAEHCSPSLETKISDVLDEFQKQSLANGPIGMLTTLLAAIGVFYQFERAFDKIWRLPIPPEQNWLRASTHLLRRRLSAFFLLAGVGGTIFGVFLTNMAVAWLSRWLSSHHLTAAYLLSSLDSVITILLNALAFGALYRWLPKRPIHAGVAFRSGLLVAAIWEIGRQVLSSFVIGNQYTTAYGAIGSFIGLLLWFYWGVNILLFGAEYAFVLSRQSPRQANLLKPQSSGLDDSPVHSPSLQAACPTGPSRLVA